MRPTIARMIQGGALQPTATVQPSQRTGFPRVATLAVWSLRALGLIPFGFMTPELISLAQQRPDAVANVSATTADVFGTSSLLLFFLMMSVTPVQTVTGWRWHVVLRRDWGVAMFITAWSDLVLAAITTEETFPGGPAAHLAGHSFLVAGTLATVLLLPLALTANSRAQHWLGGWWKTLHRLVYVIWVVVLVHLLLLFGPTSFFLDALLVSGPLLLLRLPAVRRPWTAARRCGRHRARRAVALCALLGMSAAGYVPLVMELARKGAAAFVQAPLD